jgi:hypothetical protein
MAAPSGLRQGCSSACTLCPSKAAQSVQSLPQLGILCLTGASAGRSSTVRHAPSPYYLCDGRKEASASAHAPRSLRSGFRLLQPAPAHRRPLPPPQLGEHRSTHSRPFPRASLVWSVCSVWPTSAQTLHPDQSDPQPTATIRHELDRPAHWRWQSSRIKLPGSSSGSAAAAGAHHWITP